MEISLRGDSFVLRTYIYEGTIIGEVIALTNWGDAIHACRAFEENTAVPPAWLVQRAVQLDHRSNVGHGYEIGLAFANPELYAGMPLFHPEDHRRLVGFECQDERGCNFVVLLSEDCATRRYLQLVNQAPETAQNQA